jgi:hypothetical protein
MSKKHYQAIASAMRITKPAHSTVCTTVQSWQQICQTLASVLAADNPRFDRSKFLDACGLERGMH